MALIPAHLLERYAISTSSLPAPGDFVIAPQRQATLCNTLFWRTSLWEVIP